MYIHIEEMVEMKQNCMGGSLLAQCGGLKGKILGLAIVRGGSLPEILNHVPDGGHLF